MKTIPIADVSTLKNELNKYKKGKKLEIPRFNQLARMGYLGRLIMTPLDPEDPACKSYLVHIQEPQGLAAHFIELDEDLAPIVERAHGPPGRAVTGKTIAKIQTGGIDPGGCLPFWLCFPLWWRKQRPLRIIPAD